MLLTELILSKRGPLAKVWLSAHQERKLSKQQALGVDVEESCDAILEQEDGPTTLRLSGQLMLGVTRIYSRKVQYLLDDCKETREKISMAFRPGIVDLPEDQIRANKNAITYADMPNDFNYTDWTWTAPAIATASLTGTQTDTVAPANLRPATREFGAYNFGRPRAPSLYGGSTSRHASHDGETSSHLESGEFSGVDLGLQLDDLDMSIEQGRHVSVGLTSALGGREFSREASVRAGRMGSLDLPGMGMDESFGPVDLDLGFGDDSLELPRLEDDRSRRASSALSTPPPLSPPQAQLDVTPRTAARMAKAAATAAAGSKPKRPRLLVADQELELADDEFTAPNEDSDLLTDERYLPSDPEIVRLDEIASNPNAHFLPTINVNNISMIYAGPEGLAPDLRSLFTFPSNILRRSREDDDADQAAKRPRLDDEDVELGRRDSERPVFDMDLGPSGMDDTTFDLGVGDISGGGAPFPDDPQRFSTPVPHGHGGREVSLAPSRAESIAREVQYGDSGGYPLSIFAVAGGAGSRRGESASQVETPTKSIGGGSEIRSRGGMSKNTGMAMGLLRRELERIERGEEETQEEEVTEKKMSFERVSQGANRRAASAFFFELLVLGTKDMIKLEQPRAFRDIQVAAKPSLFEEIAA